jgi:aminocarboxymuconate-semialdehyde decarboxylase
VLVDVHAHLFPAAYIELLERHGREDPWHVRQLAAGFSDEELDARVRDMDRAGVDIQLLSLFPHVPDLVRRADAVAAAQLLNDLYADVVRRRPGRFRALAALPMPHVEAAIEEAERTAAMGFVGVALGTTIDGRSLADPTFDALWGGLDRAGTTVFLHPVGACPHLLQEAGMHWSVGSIVEDTVAAATLIKAEIPRRYPSVRIINSHAGGAMPLLLARLDGLAGLGGGEPTEPPSHTARRMWYDSVVHGSAPALRCAVDALGADRMVFGSDFPVMRGDGYQDGIRFIRETLDPRAADALLGGNAVAAIPLLAPETV